MTYRKNRRRGLAATLATAAVAATLLGAAAPRPPVHVDNPFAGASFYVNPDYARLVEGSVARTTDPAVRARMRAVKRHPTAVWLDRIAAIHGGRANAGRKSLAHHLDLALARKKPGRPVVATFVVYDLPGRDCAAQASNGELPLTEEGLDRYRTEYIDAIAKVFARPKYRDIRITTVIEPDGLPNLVTNLSDPECALAQSSGIQVEAVRYALDRLHAIPNVYTYLDFAHSGWLGWDSNLTQTVRLYTDVVKGTAAGLASVDGLVTNVSNYTPLDEPFLTDPERVVGDGPVRSNAFYGWNPRFDEADFTRSVHRELVAQGWPGTTGMVIDTSRNGWGGPARPTAESTSASLDTYVTESRVDRRAQRGLWCNVAGAGLGEPPRAAPAGYPGSHLDAFLWVKPPGESDGSGENIPNGEGKRPDPMCDPAATPGALPHAPLAGHWFHDQFRMLVTNAHPPVS
ncbi:glycoside hydrolase family 6 protein [Streptomyces gobitricini]|uniref:Glucanase n=1 Tax=Streptomyces gobitricini TaxID=68211 RepID=A0ABP6A6X0_9ACTN